MHDMNVAGSDRYSVLVLSGIFKFLLLSLSCCMCDKKTRPENVTATTVKKKILMVNVLCVDAGGMHGGFFPSGAWLVRASAASLL
jgi:hypothetical protein